MAKLTNAQATALEILIDQTSPEAVFRAIAEIAGEKADHVRSNWQDEALARQWEAILVIADKARTKTADIQLFGSSWEARQKALAFNERF